MEPLNHASDCGSACGLNPFVLTLYSPVFPPCRRDQTCRCATSTPRCLVYARHGGDRTRAFPFICPHKATNPCWLHSVRLSTPLLCWLQDCAAITLRAHIVVALLLYTINLFCQPLFSIIFSVVDFIKGNLIASFCISRMILFSILRSRGRTP